MRVGLVGCVSTKRSEPAAARDLYVSPLFRGRVGYVDRSCDRWFVLSALHGLVKPETVIAPYDVALSREPPKRRAGWWAMVLSQLRSGLGELSEFVERHITIDPLVR